METLKELFARVLDIDKNDINDNSSPNNVALWDSFNGLMLVSELEKNFNVRFNINEVMSVKNFKDVKWILKKHNVTEGIDG